MKWLTFLSRNKAKPGASPPRAESSIVKEVVMTKKKKVEAKPIDQEAADKALRKAKSKDMGAAPAPEPAEE